MERSNLKKKKKNATIGLPERNYRYGAIKLIKKNSKSTFAITRCFKNQAIHLKLDF